jgi:hypothetical protein
MGVGTCCWEQSYSIGLAKVVGEYLDSQRAEEAIQGALIYGPSGNKIRVHTARRWLNKLGLERK